MSRSCLSLWRTSRICSLSRASSKLKSIFDLVPPVLFSHSLSASLPFVPLSPPLLFNPPLSWPPGWHFLCCLLEKKAVRIHGLFQAAAADLHPLAIHIRAGAAHFRATVYENVGRRCYVSMYVSLKRYGSTTWWRSCLLSSDNLRATQSQRGCETENTHLSETLPSALHPPLTRPLSRAVTLHSCHNKLNANLCIIDGKCASVF